MLVDDEPQLVAVLKETIEVEGYDVSIAESVAALTKAFDGAQPDVMHYEVGWQVHTPRRLQMQ